MKILALTVGTGRNRTDIAQAISFSIQTIQPDRVVFLTSSKTHEETMPHIQAFLKEGPAWEEHLIGNENDVQFLYAKYRDLLEPFCAPGELHVDFTSGTKAMSAALFAAGIALNAKQVYYVTGKRDETGRVMKSEEVMAIHPAQVIADRELAEARRLFNEMDYDAAWKLAERTQRHWKKGSRMAALANTIRHVGKAYAQWDRFEWDNAAKTILEHLKPKWGLQEYADIDLLKRQGEFCRRLQKGFFDKARLMDLLANARRRFRQGRYDDALSRLYRAYEYLLQIELMDKYRINTSTVTLEELQAFQLSEATKEKMTQRVKWSDGKIKLGLRDCLELLAELGSPVGKKLIGRYWNGPWQPGDTGDTPTVNSGPLQQYLNKRNDSYLAHGTQPAERQIVSNLLELYEEALRKLVFPTDFEEVYGLASFIKI